MTFYRVILPSGNQAVYDAHPKHGFEPSSIRMYGRLVATRFGDGTWRAAGSLEPLEQRAAQLFAMVQLVSIEQEKKNA